MMRAVWNGQVLAEAPRTVQVEGNHYFPPDSIRTGYLTESSTKSVCPWKGLARYYTINVDDRINPDAAWCYPRPSPLARRIKGHVAFWHGVRVEGEPEATPRREDAASGGCRGLWARVRAGGRTS